MSESMLGVSSGSGTLAGTTQSGSGAYGTVPTVASPQATQSTAISGDLSNLGNITALTTGLDTASATGYEASLEALIPGYSALNTTAAANAQSDLSGVIGSDVMTLLNTQAAERGVSFDPNSANTNAAALRAMGLTSESLKTQGATELTNLVNQNKTQQYDPSSLLVTPGQQQSAQNAANVYASSPNPTLAALTNQSAASSGYKTGASSGGATSSPSGYTAPVLSSAAGIGGTSGGTSGFATSGGTGTMDYNSTSGAGTSGYTNQEIDDWLNQDESEPGSENYFDYNDTGGGGDDYYG